jgi:hypothetical protein
VRRPPPWNDFTKFPVVSGTIVLALAVSLASWSGKVDVNVLEATVAIRRGELWRLLRCALPHANVLQHPISGRTTLNLKTRNTTVRR